MATGWSEETRVAALHSYDIVDTPGEPEFDDIVAIAARACRTPIALINLIDVDRQWTKAAVGFPATPLPLSRSICNTTLLEDDLLLVPDTTKNRRIADNPFVTGEPYTRFYAGVPLRTPAGVPIGVLCVADTVPRELDEQQLAILRALARGVMGLLEARRAIAERDRALARAREADAARAAGEARSSQILDSAIDYAIVSFDLAARVTSWNKGARRILGWRESEMIGRPADRFFVPEDVAAGVPAREFATALATGRSIDERWHLRADGGRFWASGEMMALHDQAGATIGFIKILRDRTGQREAAERLQRSQRRVAAALDTGLIGFFEWDVQAGILTGDSHFARFYDLDPAQAKRGVRLADVSGRMHPGDLPAVRETLRRSIETGADYTQSFRLFTRDGRMCWLMTRGRCVERGEDGPLRYAGVSIDITDTRLAEGRLRVLSDAAAALLGASDPDAVLAPLLDAAAAEIGFDKSYSLDLTANGRNLTLVQSIGLTPSERGELACIGLDRTPCGLVVEGGKPVVIGDVQRTTDPRLAAARRAGLSAFAGFPVVADGRLTGILSFGSTRLPSFGDETIAFFATLARYLSVVRERQSREQQRSADEARYRALFDNIDAGFCVIEIAFDAGDRPVDYRFLETNPAFEHQTGLVDARGKWMRDLVPAHEQRWFDLYGAVALTGDSVRFEEPANALGRWYEVQAYRVGDPAARRVAALFNDITGRKRSEHELRRLNETLESRVQERTAALAATEAQLRQSQKMEAVGQLTGGLAHDFNNMLTAVSGGLELLQRRLDQKRYDELGRYMEMAQSGARRAAALTQRLLAFSRRQTLAPTVTDVDGLVAGMHDIIDRTLGPAIRLSLCATEGLWPTMVDAAQLENALLNLCINARDAMPEGGSLTIETANISLDARAAVSQELEPGDYVSLCVTDTGVGIAADMIDKIFDPFFTTKPLGQGTGLGLSMIYGFTRQSGGQVRAYSEVGHGTTMCLYLPRHAGAVALRDDAAASGAIPRAAPHETILVVEDEDAIRQLVVEILSEAGYRVLQAADGPGGVECLRTAERIDLLVTDVGLPGGLNGRQVADAGRRLRPGLRTLFMTGYAANAAIGAGHLEQGMEVLTKPFNVEDLVRRIRAIIEREPDSPCMS